jgi:hypothetical protein
MTKECRMGIFHPLHLSAEKKWFKSQSINKFITVMVVSCDDDYDAAGIGISIVMLIQKIEEVKKYKSQKYSQIDFCNGDIPDGLTPIKCHKTNACGTIISYMYWRFKTPYF